MHRFDAPGDAACVVVLSLVLASIVLLPPKVSVVSVDRLHEACGAQAGYYDACTRFIAYRLNASCLQRGEEFGIAASVTFRPWILLKNLHQLDHEYLHVGDIGRYAADYVTELERIAFKTQSQCEGEALQEMAKFGETMRGFALRSNRERHPLR